MSLCYKKTTEKTTSGNIGFDVELFLIQFQRTFIQEFSVIIIYQDQTFVYLIHIY